TALQKNNRAASSMRSRKLFVAAHSGSAVRWAKSCTATRHDLAVRRQHAGLLVGWRRTRAARGLARRRAAATAWRGRGDRGGRLERLDGARPRRGAVRPTALRAGLEKTTLLSAEANHSAACDRVLEAWLQAPARNDIHA